MNLRHSTVLSRWLLSAKDEKEKEKQDADELSHLLESAITNNNINPVIKITWSNKELIEPAFALALRLNLSEMVISLYQSHPDYFPQTISYVMEGASTSALTVEALCLLILKENNTDNKKLLLSCLSHDSEKNSMLRQIIKIKLVQVCSLEEFISFIEKELCRDSFSAIFTYGRLDILQYLDSKLLDQMKSSLDNDLEKAGPIEDIEHCESLAVQENQIKILTWLMGKNNNFKDTRYYRQFHMQWLLNEASRLGHSTIVGFLIENYPYPFEQENAPDVANLKETLLIGIKKGHLKVVKILLEELGKYSSNYRGLIFSAVQHQHMDILRYLIEKKAFRIHEKDAGDLTPLMWAAKIGNVAIFNYLLSYYKRLPQDKDANDNTLCHLAAEGGSLIILRTLFTLLSKEDWICYNVIGYSPIQIAALHNRVAAVNFFIEKGIFQLPAIEENTSLTRSSADRCHPIIHAISESALETVQYFVETHDVRLKTNQIPPEEISMELFLFLFENTLGTQEEKILFFETQFKIKNNYSNIQKTPDGIKITAGSENIPSPLKDRHQIEGEKFINKLIDGLQIKIKENLLADKTYQSLLFLYTHLRCLHEATVFHYDLLIKHKKFIELSKTLAQALEDRELPSELQTMTRFYLARQVFLGNIYIVEKNSPLAINQKYFEKADIIRRTLTVHHQLTKIEKTDDPLIQDLRNVVNRILAGNEIDLSNSEKKIFSSDDWLPENLALYQSYLEFINNPIPTCTALVSNMGIFKREDDFDQPFHFSNLAIQFFSESKGNFTAHISNNTLSVSHSEHSALALRNATRLICQFLDKHLFSYQKQNTNEAKTHHHIVEITIDNENEMQILKNAMLELNIKIIDNSTLSAACQQKII